jgi:hypothetical protein
MDLFMMNGLQLLMIEVTISKKKIVRYITIWIHLRCLLYVKAIFPLNRWLWGTGKSMFFKMSTGIFLSPIGKVITVYKGIPLQTGAKLVIYLRETSMYRKVLIF